MTLLPSPFRRAALAAALLAAPLAACGAPPGAAGPPVTTDPRGAFNRAPESPNSLPPGFLTDRPFTPPTGIVGTTRVGP